MNWTRIIRILAMLTCFILAITIGYIAYRSRLARSEFGPSWFTIVLVAPLPMLAMMLFFARQAVLSVSFIIAFALVAFFGWSSVMTVSNTDNFRSGHELAQTWGFAFLFACAILVGAHLLARLERFLLHRLRR